jgi:hypothetical protein
VSARGHRRLSADFGTDGEFAVTYGAPLRTAKKVVWLRGVAENGKACEVLVLGDSKQATQA